MKTASPHRAPTVSVVIPVFNKAELTVQCLTELEKVTTHLPYEVIVVDNASSDDTQVRLQRLKLPLRVIHNEENVGFARACNQGAALAHGEFLLFLNNDTVPRPGWLEPLVHELRDHPEVVAAGSRLLYGGGLVQHAAVAFARETRIPYHPYRFLTAADPRVNRRREVQAVTAACMIIRPDWFERCGRFNAEFLNGYEDLDLCLNLRRRGGVVVYQPKSLLYHLESQTAGRMKYDDRNRALFFRKWRNWLLADEDEYYLVDGYKMVYRRFGGQRGARLMRIESQDELRRWAVVSECQRLAAEGQRDPVITLLQSNEVWPADAGVRRWAAAVCRRLGLVEAALRHCQAAQSDEAEPNVSVLLADLEAGSEFDSNLSLAEWGPACTQGFTAVKAGDAKSAAIAFDRARICGLHARTAIQLEAVAAQRSGNLEAVRQCALALLARHHGDPVGLRLLKEIQSENPDENSEDSQSSARASSPHLFNWQTCVAAEARLTGGDSRNCSPLTSIIVLAHNQLEHTQRCVESVLAHTRTPFELILVDNGSTDGTADFFGGLSRQFSHIHVVSNQSNRGFAAGNNQGLTLARGEFVVLLNNDTVVTPGWIEGLTAVIQQQPRLGVVGPMSNSVSGPQRVREVSYQQLEELPAFASTWRREHAGQFTEVNRVVGFCLLATREVIERVGGLDEQFGSGNFEDDDFCIRAKLAGFKVGIAHEVFIHHAGSQTFKGAGIDYAAAMLRNWSLFKKKWNIPDETPITRGYRTPEQLPIGCSLKVALPTPAQQQASSDTTQFRRESADSAPDKEKVELPPVAQLGGLGEARSLRQKSDLPRAWQATMQALQHRPFHPEAHLLLAEIALAAGDGGSARRLAEYARKLTPGWARLRQFLKGNLKGNAKPDWLVLPEEIRHPKSEIRNRLSVCLIVRNEEQFLEACLQSVKPIAHQIVVVDTGSTDRSVEIAKAAGAEVYSFEWCDDFAAARNEALAHANGDWVLSLDADEQLDTTTLSELEKHLRSDKVVAWRLPLADHGREAEGCHYVPRLFRNAPGAYWKGRIHEQVFDSLESRRREWGLENKLGAARIIHHGYAKEVSQSREKVARNLRLLEQAIAESPDNPNLLMNYGLELHRSGRETESLNQYRAAYQCLAVQPADQMIPELRETLLIQFSARLLASQLFDEVAEVLRSPFSQRGGFCSSLHFTLGLALMRRSQWKDAAVAFKQCLVTRRQPSLTPANTDIHTGAPWHCLTVCQREAGQLDDAQRTLTSGLKEHAGFRPLLREQARLAVAQGKPIDALQAMNNLIATDGQDVESWELGGQIALSRFDFHEFAADWTGEAIRLHSAKPAIAFQRAEALLFNKNYREAALQLRQTELDERGKALLAFADALAGNTGAPVPDDEPALSRAFLDYYRTLIQRRAEPLVRDINEALDRVAAILPTAAGWLRTILAEAQVA